jgi:hypothetical protein
MIETGLGFLKMSGAFIFAGFFPGYGAAAGVLVFVWGFKNIGGNNNG